MANRAKVTIDWLRKGREISDLAILRQLISEATKNNLSYGRMNSRLFERSYDLSPNPMTPHSEENLDKELHFKEANEIDGMEDSIVPKGTTLQSQIQSLLPSTLPQNLKSSLAYVLTRAITGDTPTSEEWMWKSKSSVRGKGKPSRRKRQLLPIAHGLDCQTAALLTVLVVRRLAKCSAPWVPAIWQYYIEQVRSEQLEGILSKLTTTVTVRETRDILLEAISAIRMEVPNEPVARDLSDKWVPLLAAFEDQTLLAECRMINAFQGTSKHTNARTILRQEILARLGSGISDIRTQFSPSSEWGVLSIRGDGPTGGILKKEHNGHFQRWESIEGLLDVLRRDLRILSYDPLRKILSHLSNIETPGRPTARDVIKSTGLKARAAYYTMNNLGLVLNERYILDPSIIGLKYRYIFSPKRRPILKSKGLVERMNLANALHSSLTIHFEPRNSDGPDLQNLPIRKGKSGMVETFQLTATQEIISMRMDLFNTETGLWSTALEKAKPTRPEKSLLWLYRESSGKPEFISSPSQREIDLIGVLCALRGNSSVRRWLLQNLRYPSRTAHEIMTRLVNNGILRLLYLPALEYVGLSSGLVMGANFSSLRDLNEFLDRVVVASPFAQIRFDPSSRSAIALIRTPHLQVTSIDGALGQWLDDIDADYVSATMERRRTYWLTVLQRLYNDRKESWTDPWEP